MKMKINAIIALIMLTAVVILSGCVKTPSQTTIPSKSDTVTTASIVNDANAFQKAISSSGTWIIATLSDMSITKDLILDGVFTNGKKDANGNDIVQRKIALYTQDENKTVTNRFTLTAPKLTVKSPNARIQSGTFVGDVFVEAANFQLVDATVKGNIYFTTDEAQSTFKMDTNSSVTGVKELKK